MANFTNLLINLCTIQEKTQVVQGYEKVLAWSDVAVDVPCRKDSASGNISDTEIRVNTDEDIFFFNPDVVVKRGNRIIFDIENYDVIKVNKNYDSKGIHHLEVIARITDHN